MEELKDILSEVKKIKERIISLSGNFFVCMWLAIIWLVLLDIMSMLRKIFTLLSETIKLGGM